jgi:hypothetical protein
MRGYRKEGQKGEREWKGEEGKVGGLCAEGVTKQLVSINTKQA